MNYELAQTLRQVYRLMQLAGESVYRSIAFDRAAQSIEGLARPVDDLIREERLTELDGIGKSIAAEITAWAESGRMPVLEELKSRVPVELLEWLRIPGLGPKKIVRIHKELGIRRIDELKEACLDGRVARLPGLGEKSARNILSSIEWLEQFGQRNLLSEALEDAGRMLDFLSPLEGILQIELAGSLRRSRETIGDIDIVIAAGEESVPGIFDAFIGNEMVVEVLGRGETKSSVRTAGGRQIDLRIVRPDQFPAALIYFTGSKEHNVRLRGRARQSGMALNEYGLFRLDGEGETDFDHPVPSSSEQEIYSRLGLSWIPPELREDNGEIEWFEKHKELPLLEEGEIRGVIHAHSRWSDGRNTIEELARASISRGYSYLGISDHSRSAAYAGGLSVEDVRRQWEEIDELNLRLKEEGIEFTVFKGIESDILPDGSLDYPDEILEGFDFVIASVHSALDMPREQMTERFCRAIEHPATRIVGHPSGRLLLRREGSSLDMERLIETAAAHNTAIEINANPLRLDLDWRYGRKAREAGMWTSINPDAHRISEIDYIRYGVRIARKGWFDASRVVNALSAEEFALWIARR